MEKTFSIILNTRRRPELLDSLFKSIVANTSDIKSIEILLSCDNDDIETHNYLVTSGKLPPEITLIGKAEFIDRERNLHKRLNRLANSADGKYIFVLNDDTEILTSNWDKIALKELEQQGDIIYGRTHDNSCDKEKAAQYASFPIISKKAVDKLGYFMSEQLVGLGGDVHIWRVYSALNKIVDIPIDIRHTLHETIDKVINTDNVALEMRANTYAHRVDCWTMDISKDVEKLCL